MCGCGGPSQPLAEWAGAGGAVGFAGRLDQGWAHLPSRAQADGPWAPSAQLEEPSAGQEARPREGGSQGTVLEAAGLAAGAEVAVGGRLHGRHTESYGWGRVVHRPGGQGEARPGRVGLGPRPGWGQMGFGASGAEDRGQF